MSEEDKILYHKYYATIVANPIHKNIEQYPLAEYCELCPEEDRKKPRDRHHPDYNYLEIYVSVCSKCHLWLRRFPIEIPCNIVIGVKGEVK